MVDMENKFHNTIRNAKVAEGGARMMLSIILTLTTAPETALSAFPLLAALGHVTDKLKILCKWSTNLMTKIQELCHTKNKKIRDPGLFQNFFRRRLNYSPPDEDGTPSAKAKYLARYYRLMMLEMTEAEIPHEYWINEVTTDELKLVRKFFNKPDSDVAIITSALVDLSQTPLAMTQESHFRVDHMSQPSDHMSSVGSLRTLDEFLQYSPEEQDNFLAATVAADAEVSNPDDLKVFDQNASHQLLFRVNSDCCIYYDYESNTFCKNLAVRNTSRCQDHQDSANTKLMKIISNMGKNQSPLGYSINMDAFRPFVDPVPANTIYEFAPCVEGGLPAFKYSELSLKKLLIGIVMYIICILEY